VGCGSSESAPGLPPRIDPARARTGRRGGAACIARQYVVHGPILAHGGVDPSVHLQGWGTRSRRGLPARTGPAGPPSARRPGP